MADYIFCNDQLVYHDLCRVIVW